VRAARDLDRSRREADDPGGGERRAGRAGPLRAQGEIQAEEREPGQRVGRRAASAM